MHTGPRSGMQRRRDVDRESIDVTALTAAWDGRTSTHKPRFERQEFPFWKLTFAVATAIILAAALIWTVMEVRARYELAEVTRELEAEARRLEVEWRKQQATVKSQMDQRVKARAEASWRESASRGRGSSAANLAPLMSQGTTAMPAGTIACMFGYQSQRLPSGAWQQLLSQGQAQPCRTN